jgi:2-amino-4-hydroxy-6-hydroxymethyldihydropteridine diphosphokinase
MEVKLALGSNLGDRINNLRHAIKLLKDRKLIRDIIASPVYESPALLLDTSPIDWNIPFLNMAIKGSTDLSPFDLLIEIKVIEKELKRENAPKWSPRIIDIDILIYEDEVINTENLIIPHPGLYKRDFVLVPLSDICLEFKELLKAIPINLTLYKKDIFDDQ